MLTRMARQAVGLGICSLAWLGCVSCTAKPPIQAEADRQQSAVMPSSPMEEQKMRITSPAFQSEQPIPVRFTCDGENLSPELHWSNIPPEAQSLALVADDPDAPAGTWVHWVVVNLPPHTQGIPEGGPLAQGALEVPNSFKRPAYGGPCPPSGTHRYFFRLYALDVPELEGVNALNYKALIQTHAIAQAELMGTYQRR